MDWTQVLSNLFFFGIYGILAFLLYATLEVLFTTRKKKQLDDKLVVITGGSSGIGKHVAIAAASRGANVAIIARDLFKLEAAKVEVMRARKCVEKQKVECFSLDISKNYEDVNNMFDDIEELMGSIYILVNCAGSAICGKIEDTSADVLKFLTDINYISTYNCTKSVVPRMKKEKQGIVVITSSLAGSLGIYGMSAYCGSKFALRGLAETLSMEVRHHNMSVTLCCPPDTDTPGFKNEQLTKPLETKLISASAGLEKPESVAEKLIDDCLDGKFFSSLGFDGFLITTLCSGMAPYASFKELILQCLLMGPLRLISAGLLYKFHRIIINCTKDKEMSKKTL